MDDLFNCFHDLHLEETWHHLRFVVFGSWIPHLRLFVGVERMTDFIFGGTGFGIWWWLLSARKPDLFLLITRDSDIGLGMAGWLGFHMLPLLANRSINEKLQIRLCACNNLSLVLTGCNLR